LGIILVLTLLVRNNNAGTIALKCYVEAILENTQQIWFPASIIDGYKKAQISVYKPYEKCYYYYGDRLEGPGTHLRSCH
jgi:hypothetical protein